MYKVNNESKYNLLNSFKKNKCHRIETKASHLFKIKKTKTLKTIPSILQLKNSIDFLRILLKEHMST